MRQFVLAAVAAVAFSGGAAANCGPEALGTHRTLQVAQADGPLGLFNYKRSLDLAEKEIVLTFDDGPMPGKTPAVLKALADECVKATFFVVGSMVAHYPQILRQTAAAGHTIGTHTWNHAYLHRTRSMDRKSNQIAGGLHAASIVLGDEHRDSLSPLFRFPGLGRNRGLDRFVERSGLIAMSIDIDSQDWKKQTPQQVMERTLARIEARGRGIVLMHDIQARTVAILPEFLRELKARGYKIVHLTTNPAETQVALASLNEPRGRSFQVVMARTKERLQVLSAATAVASAEPARAPVLRAAVVQVATAGQGQTPGFQALGLRR